MRNAPPPPPIKILAVTPVLVKGTRGYDAWVLVRIQTDQGIEGIGECFSWAWSSLHNALQVRDAVQSIGHQLQGKDPLQIRTFLNRFGSQGVGRHWFAATSGIEIAIWDILGQVAGLPIYALLGGRIRDWVPLYANHGVFGAARTLPERVERALQIKEAGFHLFKWDPFGGIQGEADKVRLRAVIGEIQAFRKQLGPDFKLAIDAHGRFGLQGALTMAKELEPFNIAFFEEPLASDQHEHLNQLANTSSIPIAVGEHIYTRRGFKQALDTGAVRVLQPEVGTDGGILETVKVAAMAEVYDASVAPHNWCGPVVTLATAHVCAVIPNLLCMEYAATAAEDRWEDDLLVPPIQVERGELVLSDRPGLGSRLNEAVLAARRLD